MNKDTLIAYASTTDPYRFLLGQVVEEKNVLVEYLPIQRVRTVPRDATVHLLYKGAYHILSLKPQKIKNYLDYGATVIVMTNGYWRIGRVSLEDSRMINYVRVVFANHKTNLIPMKDVYEVDEMQLPEPYDTMLPREELE